MKQRYSRQTLVPYIGDSGQKKISSASVLIVGAGGLGCTVAAQLAGAGVGHLSIIDHDIVDESNLHRQILFRESDIGLSKAAVAAREVKRINSNCRVDAYQQRLSTTNITHLIENNSLVIDAADNFATSYLLSDSCLTSDTILISASVNRTFGYIGRFCSGSPSLRALFPRLPAEQTSCDTVGVTGPSVGVIASLQAQEALKVMVDDKAQLRGQLLYLDLWNYSQHKVDFSDNTEPTTGIIRLVSDSEVSKKNIVIDVRSAQEVELSPHLFEHIQHIPLEKIGSDSITFSKSAEIVCACKSGQRALSAAQQLIDLGYTNVAALVPS